jgi:hypothetical protein
MVGGLYWKIDSTRMLDNHGHFLGSPFQFGTTCTYIGSDEMSLRDHKMLRASVKVLQAGVKGPCLPRPGNWLVRQLNDEPKLLYKKWDLLERKERL